MAACTHHRLNQALRGVLAGWVCAAELSSGLLYVCVTPPALCALSPSFPLWCGVMTATPHRLHAHTHALRRSFNIQEHTGARTHTHTTHTPYTYAHRNIFDFGAVASATQFAEQSAAALFSTTRDSLLPRPWAVDDLDLALDSLEVPGRCVCVCACMHACPFAAALRVDASPSSSLVHLIARGGMLIMAMNHIFWPRPGGAWLVVHGCWAMRHGHNEQFMAQVQAGAALCGQLGEWHRAGHAPGGCLYRSLPLACTPQGSHVHTHIKLCTCAQTLTHSLSRWPSPPLPRTAGARAVEAGGKGARGMAQDTCLCL